MKRIYYLLFFVVLAVSCNQNKGENIIGEWKIISVDTDDFFLNINTDSVSVSKQFKKYFTDSLEIDHVISIAKMTYQNNIMEFGANGIFTQKINSRITTKGHYEINSSDKKIIVKLKDKVNWEMNYEFTEELLHLTTSVFEKKSEYILDKTIK